MHEPPDPDLDATDGDDVPAPEPVLRLALPKGRILDEAEVLFRRAGIDLAPIRARSRRLVHDLDGPDGPLRVYIVRDADVPTYVEHGAADCGIAGRDVLEEQGLDLYEPLDLGIGRCRLSVAEPEARPVDERGSLHLRIATKFPNLTRRHLEARGVVAEVIKLYGSIELGPLTGNVCLITQSRTGLNPDSRTVWIAENQPHFLIGPRHPQTGVAAHAIEIEDSRTFKRPDRIHCFTCAYSVPRTTRSTWW